MFPNLIKKFYLFLLFIICSDCLFAQQKIADAGLVRLIKQQDSLQQLLPVEKLYVQTDKPVYAVGDTIWFKGYLFNANYLKYSSRSGLMYIELVNDSSAVVYRRMAPLGYGIAHGQIAIDGKDIPEGSYTLRAYTNWQRNFGEDYLFTKNIYITGTDNQPWLVSVNTKAVHENDKENIYASLAFSEADRQALRLREMQLKVLDDNKTLFKGQAQTDAAGGMNITFNLPPKAANDLTMQAQDMQKGNRKQNIPLVLNRPENTDLQFMPEGGSLVAGIPTKVGFKAIGEDGKGANIRGKIYNSKQEEVATFSSLHKGMGNFALTPKPGETYTAKIALPNGQSKTYPLPQVKASGTVLNINNQKVSPTGGDLEGAYDADSLTIHLTTTPDQQAGTHYLVGQARGVICYASSVKFGVDNEKVLSISKNLFPTGITRFSLLNQQGQPLNERIVYIDHNDNLRISIKPNKQTYIPRDSVALNIKVTDKAGKPIQGSFSVAVTDNDQVITDSLGNNSLVTSLLLTADLKGTVEAPQYYLQNKNKQALDNLMLTQGWIGYEWAQVTAPHKQPQFAAEPEFQIKGEVVNMLGKKVENARITMISKNAQMPDVNQADKDGKFIFTGITVTDSASFFLKATSKNGDDFGVGIAVDKTPSPEFKKPTGRYLPWYIDTTLQKSVSKGISSRLDEAKLNGNHVLNEVEIAEKKVIKGSHNRNGPGVSDQALDEKDIAKAGDITLSDLLELKVKGLAVKLFTAVSPSRLSYMIYDKEAHFVIDGVDLDRVMKVHNINDIKGILDSYPAKDVTGIEVMSNSSLTEAYNEDSNPENAKVSYTAPPSRGKKTIGQVAHTAIKNNLVPPYAYIEITTRDGMGPYRQVTAGTYTFKPLPFVVAKDFYRPRYVDKTPNAIKDFRSTIHWDPLVITDKNGNAIVSFYASDRPNNYTVIIEGSDMNGNIGTVVQRLGGK